MGSLRDARDRFLPPSNRVYLNLTDTTIAEIAALRKDIAQLREKTDKLSEELRDTKAKLGPIASSITAGVNKLSADQDERQKVLLSILDCIMATSAKRSQDRKTILLAGWYCAGNTGDELMLKTLISHAPAELRDDIYVLAWNENPAFDPEPLNDLGVHVIRYPSTIREVDMLASCFDVLVWGGGAILDDTQYDSRQNNFNTGNLFIRLSEIMLASEKKVFAVGLSTNDAFSSQAYLARLQRIIDGAELFSLRDSVSYEVLEAAGIKMDNVARCEDIAFASPALMQPNLKIAHDGKVLGIICIHITEMHETNRAVLEDALALVGDDPDTRIVLIPFYGKGDAWHLPKLREACSNPDRIEIAPYEADIAQSPIFGCDWLITSRYHAALMADVAGIPSISLVPDMHRHYKNKLTYLGRLAGNEDHVICSSDWSADQQGRELLSKLLMEETGPQLPKNVAPDTRDMIVSTWDRIVTICA